MKLTEISDQDKSLLTLKGIEYNFIDRYNLILQARDIIGNSNYRKSLLENTIDETLFLIKTFTNQGFDNNDLDILNAKRIADKLQDIRNKL